MERTQQINIRLTPEEKKAFKDFCVSNGVDVSIWLRDLANEAIGNPVLLNAKNRRNLNS